MERAFTEAAQGQDILQYAEKSRLDFTNNDTGSDINIYNSFKNGTAQYPYEILLDTPSYPFTPIDDVSHLSNQELLEAMSGQILSMGYDILIRDVSNLGFPSYQIIIPGLSELILVTDLLAHVNNTRMYVAKMLNNPALITKETSRYIIAVMEHSAQSLYENSMVVHYGMPVKYILPGEEIGLGWVYMTAMCYALQGRYDTAANRIKILSEQADSMDLPNLVFYKGVYYYFDAMSAMEDHPKAINYLKYFFNAPLCEELDRIFCDPEKIIIKQYPTHKTSMQSRCGHTTCCEYDIFIEIVNKLREAQIRNPIKQNNIADIFNHKAR